MSAKKGERVEGRVRDVVASGEAVVETARGLVFARGALPGEQVVLSLDGKGGRTQRGRVVTVLAPSAARVAAPCPVVERCGGCSFMAASPALQAELKQRFLRDALVKAGVSPELSVPFHTAEAQLHYRRRARLSFRGGRELGYLRERSHDVVDVAQCAVLAPPLQEALAALRAELLSVLSGEGEILLALGRRGGPVAVVRSPGVQSPAVYAAAERLIGRLAGLALFAGGVSKPARFGAPEEWSQGEDGEPLEGTLGGFSQAHAEVNGRLVRRVAELAETEGARVLELYAGHGNLSVVLARGAASYTAVEHDAEACAALRRNLAARALTAKVVTGDAATQLGTGALDVLVLDPPRAGAPGVLAKVAARKPRRIAYVSCDPATLARDVKEALTAGYRVEAAEGFDMFPNTADLESVVLLVR